MKLGLVSAILPEYGFEEVINFLSENGFQSVEVACWPVGKAERRYAGVTHINVDTLDDKKVEHYRMYLQEKKIEIAAMTYSPNPLTADIDKRNFYIKHIKKVILAAKKMGVKHMNTFIGKNPAITISENMKDFKKTWPDLIKYAEDHEVSVSFENCPMYFSMDEWPGGKNLGSSPKIWHEMFSIIDSRYFGLNYDPSHLVWQRMNYIKPIYEFKDKITNVHIKDAKFYQDRYDDVGIIATPLEYHEPKLPGHGDIDWGKVVSALTDIRFQNSALIEVEDRAFEDSLEKKIEGIRISRNHIRQYID